MRKIFTLCAILFSICLNGQPKLSQALSGKVAGLTVYPENNPNARIRLCGPRIIPADILLIIDGVPVENSCFNKLNPADIESVNVIKRDSIFYSCYRAEKDILIITTKSSTLRKFIIKDILEGKTIPGATVKFKSIKDRNDSLVTAANDSGFVLTNKLKPGVEYEMEVSSVGFKNYTTQFKNPSRFHEQPVFLERKPSLLPEVVIASYPPIICRRTWCCCGTTISKMYAYGELKDSTANKNSFKVYPNPLPRGGNINLELTSAAPEISSIRVFSLSGALMLQQKINTGKWKTFSVASDKRWTAGTYIVQLLNETGKAIGQQKIIVY